MRRLTGQDAMFLYLETPASHMHVGGVQVLDPTGASEEYDFERVLEQIEERLHLAPIFRRRLKFVPLGLHHPVWFEDPDFDLEYHVRRVQLPPPGDLGQLASVAGQILSIPLDRSRPMWELHLVEGLEGGRIGVVSKTHHCAIDGVSGIELAVALMDLERDPGPVAPPEEPWQPEREPSDVEMLAYAARSLATQPVKLARSTGRLVQSVSDLARSRITADGDGAGPPLPFAAPRTSLNVGISPHRVLSFTELPLATIKEIKNHFGATVNDVVLALCSSTLRRYFEQIGEPVERDLVAMCPISVRTEAEQGGLGNRVSSMLVDLATTVDDPVERLARIAASTSKAKEEHELIGASTLQDWAEFAAPALANRAARLYSRLGVANRMRPPYNLVISNVPGPPFTLYSLGAELERNIPAGPIMDGQALNITVTSYRDLLFFGFHACREAVPDVWALVSHLEDATAELTAVLGPEPEPRQAKKRPAKKRAAKKKASRAKKAAKKAS